MRVGKNRRAILDFRTLDSAEMETLARRRLQEITRQMPQLAFELGEDTPFDIEGKIRKKIDRRPLLSDEAF